MKNHRTFRAVSVNENMSVAFTLAKQWTDVLGNANKVQAQPVLQNGLANIETVREDASSKTMKSEG
jgi:hypothetical protein